MKAETLINFRKGTEDMPGKLKNIKTRWSQTRDDVTTIYSSNKATGLNTDLELFDVLRMYLGLDERKVFIANTREGSVCEINEADGSSQVAVIKTKKGKTTIEAAEINEKGTLSEYNKEGTRKGTLVLLALLPVFLSDTEATRYFDEALKFAKIDPEDDVWDSGDELAEFGKALCRLTNNFYFRTRYASLCGNAGVSFEENIKIARYNEIVKTKITNVVTGTPKFFSEETTASTTSATTGKDLKGKFSILSHELSEKEKKMVPVMAPWYITPVWVETEAKLIQASKIFPIPFRTLLLYGVSGTGKTEGAKAIFSALGLPAVSICCSVDMTMFDFLGQLLPNVNKYGKASTEDVAKKLSIPSFEDVENDFEGVYKTLFGVEPDEYAAPADCYSKINELMADSSTDGEPDFIYVESEFVQAYRNGWGIEIQEPTIIKRNSVLAGLNKALDNDPDAASITLPTGEIVKRHPDCMIIMTTNQDYDGCNNIQQSVLSRMQNKRRIENPSKDELIERTISETKFPDKEVLRTMVDIVKEINDFCNVSDVTDGVCGPRELSNWAKRAYIDAVLAEGDTEIKKIPEEYVIRSAFPTIIEKVSQVSEDQDACVIEVLQKHYSEGDVMAAKDEYITGVA